jgi:hypothetical protein
MKVPTFIIGGDATDMTVGIATPDFSEIRRRPGGFSRKSRHCLVIVSK